MIWEDVRVQNPETAASELEKFIKEHVISGEYNFLYKLGSQQSMIQIDMRNPNSIKCYHYDLQGRAATQPLKAGIANAFSQKSQLIDVSGERRHKAMLEALRGSLSNYQDSQPPLTPDEAIESINKYRKEEASKPALTQPAAKGLQTHGLWHHNSNATSLANKHENSQEKTQQTPTTPRKN